MLYPLSYRDGVCSIAVSRIALEGQVPLDHSAISIYFQESPGARSARILLHYLPYPHNRHICYKSPLQESNLHQLITKQPFYR